ncbi:MAG TPA: heavy-metal-associated domain-containing protein [Anaerolineaceae bacterium]|nr:heavy-metal-associated domain-containing protein [Anaerolineaceae bacterium]
MSEVNYYVPGISCHHCVMTISNELSELDGVKSVHVDLEGKQVSISYESPADETAIIELLKEINYPPQL